jgi:hypothetical protein
LEPCATILLFPEALTQDSDEFFEAFARHFVLVFLTVATLILAILLAIAMPLVLVLYALFPVRGYKKGRGEPGSSCSFRTASSWRLFTGISTSGGKPRRRKAHSSTVRRFRFPQFAVAKPIPTILAPRCGSGRGELSLPDIRSVSRRSETS